MELQGDVLLSVRKSSNLSRRKVISMLEMAHIFHWSENTLRNIEMGITRFPEAIIPDLVRIGLLKEGSVEHQRLLSAHPGPLRDKRGREEDEVIQTILLKIVVVRKSDGTITLEAA